MNFKLKQPDMVQEAAKTGGLKLALEVLIFIAMFYVSQTIMSIPVAVATVYLLFKDLELIDIIRNGRFDSIDRIEEKIMGNQSIMILSLFTTAIMIVLVLLFCKVVQKRKMTTLGFKKPGMWKEYALGMLVGLGMIAVICLICALTGAASFRFEASVLSLKGLGLLLLLFVGFLIQGMSEEVLCRGYFLVSLARKKGNIWLAVLVNSVAFGALHLLNPGLTFLAMVNLILFGLFASIYFVKRGNIWGIAAIHSIWNFAQGNLFGFLVSGQSFGTTLFSCEINEKLTILNGGDFGLEGGILTTLVLLGGILLMLLTKQKDAAQEEAAAE